MFLIRRKVLGASLFLLALSFCLYILYQMQLEQQKRNLERIVSVKQIMSANYSAVPLETLPMLNSLDLNVLEQGKQEMLKHKVVIVGIARDNMEDLLVTIKHVEYLGGFFKDYRVIIFENDSRDGTKEALDAWQQNKRINIISKHLNEKKRVNHQFMADIRNNYIEALKNTEYSDFDVIMVLDMDMSFGFDVRGIFDSFSKITAWDGICSNGISNSQGKMYDAFAFRNKEFSFSPTKWQEICNKKRDNNKDSKFCNYPTPFIRDLMAFRLGFQSLSRLYWLKIVPQIQKSYSVGSNLISVDSCFGGMAFYKKKFIEECKYQSINNDCEHVYFHECMKKKGGRMMMNPSQIIRYSHYY